MPNKYPEKKGWRVPKQAYKVTNWSEYNRALCMRGDIEVWLSDAAIANWYEQDRVYVGAGTPKKFTDFAIITCHEIRQVFHLALRQCQGFINSLFRLKNLPIKCPSYSCLSKRLAALDIKCPRYKTTDKSDNNIKAIAIDSTGLKRFGRNEWHQEKHKVSGKRSWRKLHIAVDNDHYIQGAKLTDRFVSDNIVSHDLIDQVEVDVNHITADGAYDDNFIYEKFSQKYPDAEIVIPPKSGSVYNPKNHKKRNQHVLMIEEKSRMVWQKLMNYGRRNLSELCILRYKKILGTDLHSREISRQKNEGMLGCGILNKMTSLGMPKSYRYA